MIWSGNNPYFFKGKAGEGVGGPHVGLNYIWPMSIIMKAFTTDDSEEIRACLKQLRDTDGGTMPRTLLVPGLPGQILCSVN